jgi:hypothetical protein
MRSLGLFSEAVDLVSFAFLLLCCFCLLLASLFCSRSFRILSFLFSCSFACASGMLLPVLALAFAVL